MNHKCEAHHEQLQKSDKKAKSDTSMADAESTKCNAAIDFVKFLENEVWLRISFIFIRLYFIFLILLVYIV